jgi:acetyl-CoA carboxylase biotin carboxylase subunit
VDADLRRELGGMAVRAAEAVGYRNAGTVEFIMDADRNVYFMEMNTRLQVEHPVTEMVTGLDLVRAQIQIAAGRDPGLSQDDIQLRGSAIECRIYAEDPARGFLPSPGRLEVYEPPTGPGVRVDSGVYAGWTVPMDYDPMISKLIAWGRNRDEALDRMDRALGEYRIDGVATTIPFHRALMRHPDFRAGRIDTHFLESHTLDLAGEDDPAAGRVALAIAAVAAREHRRLLSRRAGARDGMSPWKRAALQDGLARRLAGKGAR